ncbi:plastocyanin/azurin family copper-binding protein [Euzebya tangerina]|uniref:plastocyanin/azurin family copper-binding protein n=1 Tax=Euzebya tangerina TaxID=591198 RepID=UPI000E323CB4|nr:plastocyanin/azurin family copper-binding protein [Euzebya tangerina]
MRSSPSIPQPSPEPPASEPAGFSAGWRRSAPLLLLVVLAMTLSACTQQEPEVSANDQVPAALRVAEVEEGEDGEGGESGGEGLEEADAVWTADSSLVYTSAPSTIPADGALLAMELTAGTPHNVVIEGFEGDRILLELDGPGVDTAQVSIPPGTYTYYCSIAGHRAAGMEGTVTVE